LNFPPNVLNSFAIVSNNDDGIQLIKLPMVLYNIFKDVSLIPNYVGFNNIDKDIDNLEEISIKIGIIFAQYNAAVLFVTPLCIPLLLEGLYNTLNSNDIIEYISQCNHIYDTIALTQSNIIPDSDDATVFPSVIINYCESMNIIPSILSKSLILKTCEHTLGRDIDSVTMIGGSLTKADLSELLFVLAQIIFTQNTTTQTIN
jgi:hypothetical protein